MSPGSKSEFQLAVERVVRGTETGDLLTYAQVATLAGRPGAARAVGQALAGSSDLPWWRVVSTSGRLVPGLEAEHAARLVGEGLVADPRHGAQRLFAVQGRKRP
ncbi:MAG TPA: MGMT family protein [Candidatus Dormibacteraeota bacterium]|nr:MGMT family protein [Candidatus Dormibacteraeota bacterium]